MRQIISVSLLASAVALAGCNQGAKQENKAALANAAAAPGNASAAPVAPIGNASANGPSATVSGGRQNFAVINNTGFTVMTLQVSPTNQSNWGPDILGQDVLPNGQQAQINFPRNESECMWDIRVTYNDGDEESYTGVNLCEVSTFTLTEDDATTG